MHRRERAEEGYVVTRVSGRVVPSEFADAVRSLGDFAVGGRIFELVLHEGAEFVGTFTDLRAFVAEALDVLLHVDGGAIAYVASTDFEYGVCRQLRALLVVEKVPIEVFRDEGEARAWLADEVERQSTAAA